MVKQELEQLDVLKEQLVDIKEMLNDEYICMSNRNIIVDQLEEAIELVDNIIHFL